MADENFTQFEVGTVSGTSYFVGYDTVLNLEQRYPASALVSYLTTALPFATSFNTALTGTPTAPNAAYGTNTTQIATTAWSRSQGTQYTSVLALNTNQNLSVTQSTSAVQYYGVSGGVFGLAQGSTYTSGQEILIYNQGAGTLIVQTTFSGDYIWTGNGGSTSLTSITLQPNDTIKLIAHGNNEFDLAGGTAAVWNVKGTPNFAVRPNFAGNTPYDSGNLPVVGGRLLSYQIITSSTTVTVPANTAYIIGEGVGPGGGSGGSAGAGASQVSIGQSGGAGTYCKFQILSPGSTLSVTIGAPGTAGAASSSGAGGTGGSSSIASQITIPGGVGGAAGTVTTYSSPFVIPSPALSALATGAASILENQSGYVPAVAYAVGSGTAAVASQPGGNSRWGAGAPSSTAGQPGTAASQYGAGASGCALSASTSAAAGAAGGPSKFILYFYASQ